MLVELLFFWLGRITVVEGNF